jgi:mannose-6-phosphate isomerase-like protein (cupin superfamily)
VYPREKIMGVVRKRSEQSGTYRWEGVATEAYADGATKQVLIGPDDGAPNFALRYFTLPPHGKSNLDHHEHDHGVMIVAGHGRVMLGERYEEIGPGDIVYIPGWERHQFEALGDGPLTFLCIIPPKTAQPDVCILPEPALKKNKA